MNFARPLRALLLGLLGALLIAGCHVTELLPGNTSGNTAPLFVAEGLWTGVDSLSGQVITGLVDADGKAVFMRADGLEYTGTLQRSGSTIAAEVDGYASYGLSFPDGSSYGIGTLNGSVTEGESLDLTLDFTTSANTSTTSTWQLSLLTLSSTRASLLRIAGTYTDAVTGASITISSAGVIFGQSASNGWSGCVLNGTVTVPDPNYNVYAVAYTYASCTGSWQALNGMAFSGLALLNINNAPPQLLLGVSGQNASNDAYGILSTLNLSD